MGVIHCCGGLRRSKTYYIEPIDGYLLCEVDILEKCAMCGHYVLQLTRIDLEHNVTVVRKSNDKAKAFFERLKNSIIFESKQPQSKSSTKKGGFYLGYSEYGVKKRCYSNITTLKLGKTPDSRWIMT